MSEPDEDREELSVRIRELVPGGDPVARRLALDGVLRAVLGTPQPERRVGRYTLERAVGKGGMGLIFRGRDPDTDSPVAIKLLARDGSREHVRFDREARMLARLAHEGIVRYLAGGTTEDGRGYLVMEWLDGRDLLDRLREGPLSADEVVTLGTRVAAALSHAHGAGVVHRDLKPSNLFLVGDRCDAVKVIDFGIARSRGDRSRLTTAGGVVGTPAYMAPEQVRGEHDERTDVYGLGATLFECLTGRPPFVGVEPAGVLLAVLSQPAPTVSSLLPSGPAALDALIARMLSKQPNERPRDMAAVSTELRVALATLSGATPLPRLSEHERVPATAGARHPAATTEPHEPELVGRQQVVGQLLGALDEAIEEGHALGVVVRGEPGEGRSALLRALARHARRRGIHALAARATQEHAGAPFATLSELLQAEDDSRAPLGTALLERMHAVASGEPGEDGQVRAPREIGDELRLSWAAHVERWAERGPMVVLLDDAHRSDTASLRLLELALALLRDRPVLLVASAPGAAPSPLRAWAGGAPQEIVLGPLGARPAERLVRLWAPDVDADQAKQLVARARGNPLELSELVRASRASGVRATEALLHRSIEGLEPPSRRVLRAAALVGVRFWPGVVAELLGLPADAPSLREHLASLVQLGLVTRRTSSRVAGEVEHEIVHESVHRAAYETLTADDRAHGHRIVASWMARRGGFPAALVAEHLVLGGEPASAVPLFARAARAALVGEDAHLVAQFVDRGLACDPTDAERATLLSLRAEAAFWRGELRAAAASATEAAALLEAGTSAWFDAKSIVITGLGQAGDNVAVAGAVGDVLAAPRTPDAESARAACLCRAATQAEHTDPAAARALRVGALTELSPDDLAPFAAAWWHRAMAAGATDREIGAGISHLVRAHAAHRAHGDARSAVQILLFLSSYYVWTGAFARAGELIEEVERSATHLGSVQLGAWARYLRGKLLVETASFERSYEVLDRVVDECRQTPRIAAGALVYASISATRAGAIDEGAAFARRASEAHDVPIIRLAARAALAHAAPDRLPDPAREAGELAAEVARHGHVVEFDALVRLAIAELHAAAGEEERAVRAYGDAAAALHRRAATLDEPLRRNDFLTGPHLNALTLRRAAG